MAKTYRVHYSSPTNFGYQKSDIKIFQDFKKANKYALTLVKDLRKNAKETDDDEAVYIENVETMETVRAWMNEGEGRVAYYKGGF